MNTKVEEAMMVLESAAGVLRYHAMRESAATLEEARATIAAHIAQQDAQLHEAWSRMDNAEARAKAAEALIAKQDATIARMREALRLTEFGFMHRRCPVCAGFNVGADGETDQAHTANCPVAIALKDSP